MDIVNEGQMHSVSSKMNIPLKFISESMDRNNLISIDFHCMRLNKEFWVQEGFPCDKL